MNERNEAERNRAIDAFRGLSIVGMIFFTVTLRLSSDLPYWLKHNVRGSFHAGDVVLPMFLFASGLSLAYYLRKTERNGRGYAKAVALRLGKLALVGVSLSYFSAYGLLEMDEVMLSALCFLTSVLLSRLKGVILIGIIFLINASYLVLMHLDGLHIFEGHYLGGYPAVLYYLQVMLLGLVIGRGVISGGLRCRRNVHTAAAILAMFAFFWMFLPVRKLYASPTFMLASALISFLLLLTVDGLVRKGWIPGTLEHLGKKPLRQWLAMYVLFLIPLDLYAGSRGYDFPLQVPWPLGVEASVLLLVLLWGISRWMDRMGK